MGRLIPYLNASVFRNKGFGAMEKTNWSHEYSVGVGIIDEQHKRLLIMINRIISAEETATDSKVISDLIDQMTRYAQEHFRFEEDLLAEFGFPLIDQHKQSHVKF